MKQGTLWPGRVLPPILLALLPGFAEAETSLHVGITSDSVWRGMSQTGNEAAPFAYLYTESASGYYGGAYVSKQDTGLGNSAGIDYYVGRLFSVGSLDIDLGYAYYRLPGQTYDDYDLGEGYLIGSAGGFSAGLYHSVTSETASNAPYGKGDDYVYVSYETELPAGASLLFTTGYYAFDEDEELWGDNDFGHAQFDLTLGPLTFSVSRAGSNSGDASPLYFLTWSHRLL